MTPSVSSFGQSEDFDEESRSGTPLDTARKLIEYQAPMPTIAQLNQFFDSYQLIYSYSRGKINKELQVILNYLQRKVARIDITNVNIIEEALQYQEYSEKINSIKVRGTSYEVEKGETLEGIEDIIKSMNLKKRGLDSDPSAYAESATEKELRALMQRYNFKVNRKAVQLQSQKGMVKCQQNFKAFFDHKRRMLF